MLPAATRCAAFGVLTLLAAACSHAVDGAAPAPEPMPAEKRLPPPSPPPPPARTAPTRPVVFPPLPSTRIGGIDYISVADVAQRLGLKLAWVEPEKKLTLTDAANRVALDADSRDTSINGLRVFLGDPARVRGGVIFLSRIDVERCLLPLVRPGLGVTLPPAPKLIVIDPGHGGKDDGTENKTLGLKEKSLTLDVGLRLRTLLEAAGYKIVMTRTDDRELASKKEVDLALRADVANREHADLFVSIHFNSATKDTRGTEVFSLAPRTQRSTDSWSTHENDSAPDDLPGNRFDHWNAVLTAAIHRELLQALKTEDRGKKIAHWAVLRTIECPGVLVEPAIISNEGEARRVATVAFRQQIAEALAAGIRDYATTLDSLRPKPQPASATVAPAGASSSR